MDWICGEFGKIEPSVELLSENQSKVRSRELPPFHLFLLFRTTVLQLLALDGKSVDGVEWERHEIVLVLPSDVLLHERLYLAGRGRRSGDLGDQVSCRSLGNAVDKDTDKWYSKEQEEG